MLLLLSANASYAQEPLVFFAKFIIILGHTSSSNNVQKLSPTVRQLLKN